MKFQALLAALVLVAVPCQFAPASAADKDDMAMPSMDCTTANATMMKMMSPEMMKPMAMDANASLDKNFAMEMHMMTMHGMQMAKLEAKCGKDAKTRAMAEKLAGDLQQYVNEFSTPPQI